MQLINFSGIEKLSQADLRAVIRAASIIDIHPDWLMAVMKFESGFDPARKNAAGSGATGLIQFMPSTAKGLQTTTDALSRMTFIQQMEYVIKYFGEKAGLRSLEDTYLRVFYPVAIGKPMDWVVGRDPSPIYTQNIGFDPEPRKGYITKQDITSTIRSVYNAGLKRGYVNVTETPFPESA